MTQFFQTIMGRRFYEGTLPSIAKSLKSIAESLEQQRQEQPAQRGPRDLEYIRDNLLGAYLLGYERDGQMEWEDVDDVYRLALQSIGVGGAHTEEETAEAIRKHLNL
jgi:hypothetical protein